jgi:eukaryotic-like serine/threonine-protein kinase
MSSDTKQRVLRPGVVIAEKYRVDKAIARGGFSVIYRGTHVDMERPVALKLLALDDEIKPSWLERFTREAKLASQLTHPNTVTIFDYGQDPRGFLYIAMEWVDGQSLYHYLREKGALGAREVAQVTLQILESLDEAHSRGFLHRDLKPSNVMLTTDYEGRNTIKVLDFGIAKHLEEREGAGAKITHQGAFVGTPRYAAPEQLDGEELTPAADIYSLGLLMWEALVGDPAVPSTNYGECVEKHLGDEPWRLPDSVQCPPGLDAVLYRALEKSTDRRYKNSRQMHRDLAAWLDSDEARELDDAEFLVGASPSSLEARGRAGEPSDVDDQALFAGLEAPGTDDEAPLDLHGASTTASTDARPINEDDTFERELLALADQSDKSAPPPMPSSEGPKEAPPGGSDGGRARPASPGQPGAPSQASREIMARRSRSAGDESRKLTLVVAAAAGALVLAAGLYAVFSGDADDEPEAVEEPAAAEEVVAESEDEIDIIDDGTPTYSADMIFLAVRQSGWSRIGKVDTLELEDTLHTSARFRKANNTVHVTVYETDSLARASEHLMATQEPAQAVQFGKTTVQASPGARDGSTEGVQTLMSTMQRLKSLAQEEAQK